MPEIHLPAARVLADGHQEDTQETRDLDAPIAEPEPPRNQNNYRITEADKLGTGSLKNKCYANLSAIELLKYLETESRSASQDEKQILLRYVGWGGLPQVFDPLNKTWAEERQQLENLLTPDELDSARATTLNAHYTAPVVIRAMSAALERFGFTHGRILEPALGLGHFIGLIPDEMRSRSLITGVEIDSVTTRLARMLYPDADIRHQPFEETKLADGFYDVAISNIPFGDYKPFDARFKSWNFVIHDYFFAKALDKVRPVGLILFITSRGTLDKLDGALREYLSSQADLLGAIRLPNDAFKKNANPEVTTDLVMLRKRLPGELPAGPAWKELAEINNSAGEAIPVNEYFAAHPEMMLGEMRLEGTMYGRNEPTLIPNARPLAEQPPEVIALLPKDVFKPETRRVARPLRSLNRMKIGVNSKTANAGCWSARSTVNFHFKFLANRVARQFQNSSTRQIQNWIAPMRNASPAPSKVCASTTPVIRQQVTASPSLKYPGSKHVSRHSPNVITRSTPGRLSERRSACGYCVRPRLSASTVARCSPGTTPRRFRCWARECRRVCSGKCLNNSAPT